jgi:hypothetical protein
MRKMIPWVQGGKSARDELVGEKNKRDPIFFSFVFSGLEKKSDLARAAS